MKRIVVKSFLKDAKNTGGIPSYRSAMIEKASSDAVPSEYNANRLANTLHPEYFPVRLLNAGIKNGFMYAEIAAEDMSFYFKGAQYLGIRYFFEGRERFSSLPVISASGEGVLRTAFLKEYDENAYSFFEAAPKDGFIAVSLEGHMNFSGIRDSKGAVVLTDITAFPSAYAFASNTRNIFHRDVKIYLACEDDTAFENAVNMAEGFSVSRYSPEDLSLNEGETLFVTGEYDFCERACALSYGRCRLIKKYPLKTVKTYDTDITHKVKVIYRGEEYEAVCKQGQVLSDALLSAGVPTGIRCSDGECGYCTLRLVSGEVKNLLLTGDRRKSADVKYGYIHPCSVTAVSDIILEL